MLHGACVLFITIVTFLHYLTIVSERLICVNAWCLGKQRAAVRGVLLAS